MDSGDRDGRRSVLAGQAPRDSPSGRGSMALAAGAFAQAVRDASQQQTPAGRASVRNSARYSRSSVRASVRGAARGTAIDSSGLPFERVLCIDEEGRDRTPKPLVAALPHGTELGGGGGWGSNGPPATAAPASERGSVLGFAPLLPGGIPSDRSFLGASEAGDASWQEASSDGGPLPPGAGRGGRRRMSAHSAAGGWDRPTTAAGAAAAGVLSPERGGQQEVAGTRGIICGGREALPPAKVQLLDGGLLAAGRPGDQPATAQHKHQKHLRSKATQCAAAAHSSRGVQVLPWELRGSGAADDASTQGGSTAAAGAETGRLGTADADEEEEALLAMQHSAAVLPGGSGGGGGGGGGELHRGSPTRTGNYSQASSRRQSAAGSGRMSVMHGAGDDTSRPPTSMGSRRTSMQSGEWSRRDSLCSSRTSFAAFMADGRGSVMSVAGFYPQAGGTAASGSRASVLSVGGHGGHHRRGSAVPLQPAAGPPQPTAAELAAAAARRQRAEQERALARLPGLMQRLQAAERAVLLNRQHARLARFHGVQCCQLAASGPAGASGTPAVSSGLPEAGSQDGKSPSQDSLSGAGEATLEGSAGSSAASPAASLLGAGASGAATPLSTGRLHAREELPLLWSCQSELSGELPVSCLAFNRAAPGLLAVGFGRLQYEVSGTGLVAVWSLANPTHPIWHAATPCGVSALDWSGRTPSCLAVGMFDGSVALYGVHGGGASVSGAAKPLARAPPAGALHGAAGAGHAEPVWRLRHVPRASDPGEEMLVSISSDGRMLEWKSAGGLECSELLHLKRQHHRSSSNVGGIATRSKPAAQRGGGKDGAAHQVAASEGLLGRAAGGTCFAFCPADPRTYLVGTEDGGVHRCSAALSEQYNQSYSGHLAPVYQVCWSPFSPSHFLTASADCSVRLWDASQPSSLWTFQLPGAKAEVADAAFSPAAATLFAAAAGNTLQLWDMERSVLAPRAAATRFGVRLTALAFSPDAPVVVAGADDGAVCFYSLAGAESAAVDEQEQRQRLEAALQHHMAQHVSD